MEVQNQNSVNQPVGTPPDNYLVWAILSTILCCLPLGVYSIIKSAEVNGKWQAGDYDGARDSADKAKKFAIYSAIAAVIGWVIYFVFFGVAIFASAASGN